MDKNMKDGQFIKPNQDGSVDISLSRPISIGGASVSVLRMREPTLEDQLANDTAAGGDLQKEAALVANLCMVAPDELRQLKARDYRRCQVALLGFLD